MDNPYTMADYERLQQVKRGLDELLVNLDKGESCGVNCATARAIRDDMVAKINAIEKGFMQNPSELSQG